MPTDHEARVDEIVCLELGRNPAPKQLIINGVENQPDGRVIFGDARTKPHRVPGRCPLASPARRHVSSRHGIKKRLDVGNMTIFGDFPVWWPHLGSITRPACAIGGMRERLFSMAPVSGVPATRLSR